MPIPSKIPHSPVDHPHQHFITGKLSIQTNSVPLRMLLQRAVKLQKSPGVKQNCWREVFATVLYEKSKRSNKR
jgi:hypothetical protein